MQSIFQVIGVEWEYSEQLADEILLQLFPQTATWGLRYWEELLQIPVNESVDIVKRRALVMARIKFRSPVTPKRIADVVKSLTGEKSQYVEVTENVEPHVFMVTVGVKSPGIDYSEIYQMLKRIKPSHESFYLGNIYSRGFTLKRKQIHGFSKTIHAIGTFVCSKGELEFIATKGYRNTRALGIKKSKVHGKAVPLVCSKSLVSRIRGQRFKNNANIIRNMIDGTSKPLICREDLKYTIQGFLNDEDIEQYSNNKNGNSKPFICSKNLKFTRIEVVK